MGEIDSYNVTYCKNEDEEEKVVRSRDYYYSVLQYFHPFNITLNATESITNTEDTRRNIECHLEHFDGSFLVI